MDPQVQHDPRTKQQIKEALYRYLYDPVQKAFKRRLDELIVKNCLTLKLGHKSFNYKGTLYTSEPPPYPRKANRLAPELLPVMKEYLDDLHRINDREMPFVMGYINQVLNASNGFDDYLALFPDALHRPIQEFIRACPCHNHHLTPAQQQALQARNQQSIDLLKQRLVVNLLI